MNGTLTQADAAKVSFSFGENWTQYSNVVTDNHVVYAQKDIKKWLGANAIKGKDIIDIGSGSGVHSYGFHSMGAKRIVSLDVDPHSVSATKAFWEKAGSPDSWKVMEASILDTEKIMQLGKFDIVYSWGVLHHTGSMWQAIENALSCTAPGGQAWIAIYTKGPNYEKDLALKQRYNSASKFYRRCMVGKRIVRRMIRRATQFKNPLTWNQQSCRRGMNTYYDMIDWLGGLPYEVASPDEVLCFARERGFEMERIHYLGEGGCSTYVFRSKAQQQTESKAG